MRPWTKAAAISLLVRVSERKAQRSGRARRKGIGGWRDTIRLQALRTALRAARNFPDNGAAAHRQPCVFQGLADGFARMATGVQARDLRREGERLSGASSGWSPGVESHARGLIPLTKS